MEVGIEDKEGQIIPGEGVHSSKDLLLFLGVKGSDVISPPPHGWLFSWRNRSTSKYWQRVGQPL